MFIAHCKLLHRETGALVVYIDHTGLSDQSRARGWSGKRAAVDTEIEVSRTGDIRRWRIAKQKDNDDSESYCRFKLERVSLGFHDDGNEESSCVVVPDDDTGAAPGEQVRAAGKYEPAIMALVRDEMDVPEIVRIVKEDTVHDGTSRDRRELNIAKAVERLLEKKLLRKVRGKNSVAPNLITTKDFEDGT
jgi:hypothetical protein